MTFDEVLDQVRELLQQRGRVTYRSLKRRFELDDEYLEDLKGELIRAEGVAADEDGDVLVWTGGTTAPSDPLPVISPSLPTPSSRHPDAPPQPLTLRPSEGERRQLTVEFIDLVGSTTLSQQLDPEDYHARVVAYQAACQRIIARYEGHIAQYLGDGVLVYFGYPVAHEEDAVRAVRSGLEIVTAVSQLAYTPPLQVRIGIHTGPVVVSEIGAGERTERLALGETPNIAARVQGQANPDEVMVSAATYRLVEGLFACEDRGQPDLKGVTMPLTLYRAVKESDAHSRFEVVVRKGLTPLIGREHEFGLLRERWERVKDGTGQVVLLSGEPGIGKSRLVEALKESVEPEGVRFLELRCSPYAQNSALAPVIEHLQRTLHFQPKDSADEKLRKLEQSLSPSPLALHEAVPFFASLLSLPASRSSLPALSPQKQKEKTHEALVAWLCAEAKQQAVTYAWEDLHWADPSTLELLTLFLAQVPTTRLLAVFTYRPEFTPPWGAHSYLSQLTLSRLGRNHVETMVAKVTGDKILSREIVQQIVSKTDGVPLFVEELTKSVVEATRGQVIGNGGQEGKLVGVQHAAATILLDVPATLQDALMARLDRLGAVKEIAQVGATIGREFTYALLRAVSPLDEETLQRGLKQLVAAELVYQSGLPPQARYLFKHALVQDTAYQSLLKSRRQQLHQSIGKVLEEQFPQTVETQPELVAHHYTEAGLIEQAIPYWQQAGQRAIQQSANEEAITHVATGLGLLKTLPDTSTRVREELLLQTTLGHALTATKGWSNPAVGEAYFRSLELCRQVGDSSQLAQALVGFLSFSVEAQQFQIAQELGEELLSLGQKTHDQPLIAKAHLMLGFTLFFRGRIAPAYEHEQQGLALYPPPQGGHREVTLYGYDSRIPNWFVMACALWVLGYPDQALRSSEGALAFAQDLSHPYCSAIALYWVATFHRVRRAMQATQKQAEDLLALCTEQGFSLFMAWGTILQGSVLAEQSDREQGITLIQQGLTASRATGGGLRHPYWLALLAEAYGKVGKGEEGLYVLREACAIVDKTGERWCEAELYRLKGELTLQKSEVSKSQIEAEECFLKAIEIAQSQKAKSWELRAATSLARLWQQQGKKKEAHKMLTEIYGWFTEGSDTKDLQEAKALLDE